MGASAADLIPAVEAYLESNGFTKTLSSMKSEAAAKKMTPSKAVRVQPSSNLLQTSPIPNVFVTHHTPLRHPCEMVPPHHAKTVAAPRPFHRPPPPPLTRALLLELCELQAKDIDADLVAVANAYIDSR